MTGGAILLAASLAARLAALDPRFDPLHAGVAVAVAWDESRLDPCVVSTAGDEGLWQWRGPRRWAMHASAGIGRDCVSVSAQVRFFVDELTARPEGAAFFAATTPSAARAVLVCSYEARPC